MYCAQRKRRKKYVNRHQGQIKSKSGESDPFSRKIRFSQLRSNQILHERIHAQGRAQKRSAQGSLSFEARVYLRSGACAFSHSWLVHFLLDVLASTLIIGERAASDHDVICSTGVYEHIRWSQRCFLSSMKFLECISEACLSMLLCCNQTLLIFRLDY